jgi:asparagine synthetase B (glutamine-hydrolysing)
MKTKNELSTKNKDSIKFYTKEDMEVMQRESYEQGGKDCLSSVCKLIVLIVIVVIIAKIIL